MMWIKAKYPGRCKACQEAIGVGDLIVWQKGAGAFHSGCVPEDVQKSREELEAELAEKYRKGRDEALEYLGGGGEVKPLKSKFDGRCRICGKKIGKGEDIRWSKKTGALHIECWYEAAGLADMDAREDAKREDEMRRTMKLSGIAEEVRELRKLARTGSIGHESRKLLREYENLLAEAGW